MHLLTCIDRDVRQVPRPNHHYHHHLHLPLHSPPLPHPHTPPPPPSRGAPVFARTLFGFVQRSPWDGERSGATSARRRRERRLRSWWRHEQQSVRMALTAATHHSAEKVVAGETYSGLRAQKTVSEGRRPRIPGRRGWRQSRSVTWLPRFLLLPRRRSRMRRATPSMVSRFASSCGVPSRRLSKLRRRSRRR